MTTKFTTMELAKLPKWAMLKVLELQHSECDLRQHRRGHHDQAVIDAARQLSVLLNRPAVTAGDLGKAQLDLTMAVNAWEDDVVDQKFAGMGGS